MTQQIQIQQIAAAMVTAKSQSEREELSKKLEALLTPATAAPAPEDRLAALEQAMGSFAAEAGKREEALKAEIAQLKATGAKIVTQLSPHMVPAPTAGADAEALKKVLGTDGITRIPGTEKNPVRYAIPSEKAGAVAYTRILGHELAEAAKAEGLDPELGYLLAADAGVRATRRMLKEGWMEIPKSDTAINWTTVGIVGGIALVAVCAVTGVVLWQSGAFSPDTKVKKAH